MSIKSAEKPLANNWLKQSLFHEKHWFKKGCGVNELCAPPLRNVNGINAAIKNPLARLKNDRTTTVVMHKVAGEKFVVKRYNPRNQWHKIKRALRQTRAQRCWQMSYLFAQVGLNVARPIMMLEQRFGPLRGDAFFVNQMLEGQELLSALPKMQQDEQHKVKAALVDAFEVMAKSMISHGDMKASNLIWTGQLLYFIDLDAAQQHRSKSAWLKANQKDRKRFLKNWQNSPELLALFSDL